MVLTFFIVGQYWPGKKAKLFDNRQTDDVFVVAIDQAKLENEEEAKEVFVSSYGFSFDDVQLYLPSCENITVVDNYDRGSKKRSIHRPFPKFAPGLSFVYPPFSSAAGYGVQHSKLLMIQSDNILRIAISSCNFCAHAMTDISQAFWIIDLPKLEQVNVGQRQPKRFALDLAEFVRSLLNVPGELAK